MAQTPKKAYANISASQTASEVIAAVPFKSIRVVSLACICGSTGTNITFNSSTNAITCLIANGANGGEILSYMFEGWFQTTPGEALTATTGSGSATGVLINYLEI